MTTTIVVIVSVGAVLIALTYLLDRRFMRVDAEHRFAMTAEHRFAMTAEHRRGAQSSEGVNP